MYGNAVPWLLRFPWVAFNRHSASQGANATFKISMRWAHIRTHSERKHRKLQQGRVSMHKDTASYDTEPLIAHNHRKAEENRIGAANT